MERKTCIICGGSGKLFWTRRWKCFHCPNAQGYFERESTETTVKNALKKLENIKSGK
jgi:hypothetical protein